MKMHGFDRPIAPFEGSSNVFPLATYATRALHPATTTLGTALDLKQLRSADCSWTNQRISNRQGTWIEHADRPLPNTLATSRLHVLAITGLCISLSKTQGYLRLVLLEDAGRGVLRRGELLLVGERAEVSGLQEVQGAADRQRPRGGGILCIRMTE